MRIQTGQAGNPSQRRYVSWILKILVSFEQEARFSGQSEQGGLVLRTGCT